MIKDFQLGHLTTALNVTDMQLDATVATSDLPPRNSETKIFQLFWNQKKYCLC